VGVEAGRTARGLGNWGEGYGGGLAETIKRRGNSEKLDNDQNPNQGQYRLGGEVSEKE